jgi:hypothetical protein
MREIMEKTLLKTKTGYFYKVPEEMFLFAAENLVGHGIAEWVEEEKPKSLIQKVKTEAASMLGGAERAVKNLMPGPRGVQKNQNYSARG